MAKENVLIIYFDIESEGYQALSEISHDTFSKDKSTLIEQASLIKRESGNIIEKDVFYHEESKNEGLVIGTIAGSLLGILGGRLGVLLGMGVGATIGSLASLDDTEENEGLIQSVSTRLQDNDVAILAVVQEEDEAFLDNYFAKFDTTIVRYDAHVIEEEIEYAEDLQKELARQVRAQMRRERSEERKRKVEEKRLEVKARFEALKEKIKS